MFFFLILDLIAAVSQARARVLQIRDLSQCAVSLNCSNSRFDAADLRKRLCIKYQGETSDCGIEDPNCSCTNSQHPGVNTCLTNQCSESEVLQALGFLNDTCYSNAHVSISIFGTSTAVAGSPSTTHVTQYITTVVIAPGTVALSVASSTAASASLISTSKDSDSARPSTPNSPSDPSAQLTNLSDSTPTAPASPSTSATNTEQSSPRTMTHPSGLSLCATIGLAVGIPCGMILLITTGTYLLWKRNTAKRAYRAMRIQDLRAQAGKKGHARELDGIGTMRQEMETSANIAELPGRFSRPELARYELGE
ncbi:hypothetical protein AA0113_g2776 [Alternaria arborescens]|uniref:CFEM domain-containing protein n=2 Tax=Alternaria sect. Alternaria TaxID=2499237 RepID=A0A4V1X7N2_9PLEO|nr:hypothetical protein AA0113_g2776 [Alternaria arborescens]